ncbi:MAG: hypothetical protein CMG55_06880 [Candidatus Marinimicrobia bacterium]|nr:hypothetical protein [Candidatus Neomarinimicrobiota bacterium]|tara:strand:+ start:462 stop:1709 length:1248 start_codon:yes stop_codon:yes gene_type:complete
MISKKDSIRIKQISSSLYEISRRVKILRHLVWPDNVRFKFFRTKSEKLPKVEYLKFDSGDILNKLTSIESVFGDTPYDHWLRSKANDIRSSVDLLNSCGTKEFFQNSEKIYGSPSGFLRDGKTSTIDLARQFESLIDSYFERFSKSLRSKTITIADVKKEIESRITPVFGSQSPEVLIKDNLSAKATASSKRIRLRKGATFTSKDVEQLVNHEAFTHVATTLNGRLQKDLKILGAKYGSITKTQEGLAVFSEFITGCIDVNRMYRISDRVIAIQMAIDGADFIEVYRFFLKRAGKKTQAFEDARRVFRGGVLSGGAPFTKDIVYLDGLVRVHNFFRSAILRGNKDAIEVLFSGKVDLDDIPILLRMREDGFLQKPKFLPNWVTDMNYLVSYFVFSNFVGKMDYDSVDDYYDSLLP